MVFNSVSVLVFLPVVFLLFKKKPGFFKTETSKWFKMVVGMSLAVVSLFIAGTLEHFRLSNIDDCGYHNQMLGMLLPWYIIDIVCMMKPSHSPPFHPSLYVFGFIGGLLFTEYRRNWVQIMVTSHSQSSIEYEMNSEPKTIVGFL